MGISRATDGDLPESPFSAIEADATALFFTMQEVMKAGFKRHEAIQIVCAFIMAPDNFQKPEDGDGIGG